MASERVAAVRRRAVRRPPSAAAPSAVRRRRPPSSPAVFSGETRVQIASRSATQPCNSRRLPSSHAPPRAVSSSRDFRRVQLTRHRASVGSCHFRSWQLRRHFLGLFQASPPASGKPFGLLLSVFLSWVLGFAVWLLNGLLWTCFFVFRDSNYHYCKAELEKLSFVVCFRGIVVPWSRTP